MAEPLFTCSSENVSAFCANTAKASAAAAALAAHATAVRLLIQPLLVEKSESPHRAAQRKVRRQAAAPGIRPAQSRQNRDVLLAVFHPRDRLGIDARTGAELPQRLAGVGVQIGRASCRERGES